jgi:hypothetical protein
LQLQAPFELNISWEIKKTVADYFEGLPDNEPVRPDVFDEAQRAVYHAIELDSFPRFLNSELVM